MTVQELSILQELSLPVKIVIAEQWITWNGSSMARIVPWRTLLQSLIPDISQTLSN